jgi:hypothetical protein
MADMTDIIVVRLTRAEAEALDDLADGAMDRLASDRKVLAAYARMDGDLDTLARACDKLRQAVLDEPNTLLWADLIKQMPDKSRTLLGKHDGLSTEAAFKSYAQHPRSVLEVERERVAKGHEPDIALEQWGLDIEEQILADLAEGKK